MPRTNFDDRRFLKGVGADRVDRHLAGDRDHRHAVELGVGDGGHQIGGPGATGGHAHADFARTARDALRRKAAALFVAGQYRAELVAKRVSDWCIGMLQPPG